MSYDLYFTKPYISFKQYLSYFKGRKNYTIKETQAFYMNEDTGVYFWFDYSDDEPDDPEAPEGRVSFELNYYRPHVFVLEAEPEVRAFVEHFHFEVFDPQIGGMEGPAYDSGGLIRGWNQGNEVSYHAFLEDKEDLDSIHARSWEEMEDIWCWNIKREELQHELGKNIFVPKIMFFQVDSILLSVIAWTDAIPTLIPRVDAIYIYRDALAPRRFLSRKKDFCIVPFKDALPILTPYENSDHGIKTYSWPGPNSPEKIVEYVKKLEAFTGPAERIDLHEILDRELVDKYTK
jgi:hypothetical protein